VQTQILNAIQFTTHYIEFILVENNQLVGSNPNVIHMRETCGQRSGMAAKKQTPSAIAPCRRAPLEVRNSRRRFFAKCDFGGSTGHFNPCFQALALFWIMPVFTSNFENIFF